MDLEHTTSAGLDDWNLQRETPATEALIGEARSWPRLSVRARALYSDTTGSFREEAVLNMSRGGLFVQTSQPLAHGTNLEIILMIPEIAQEVTVGGQVMHARQFGPASERGMGVLFTTIEPALKQRLHQYLDRLETRTSSGRRSRRVETSPEPVQLRSEVGCRETRSSAVLANLSQSGLLLKTNSPMTLFRSLALTIHLDDRPIEVHGEVVHMQALPADETHRFSVGVRFLTLDASLRQDIIRLQRQLAVKPTPLA